ncbi:MAG: tRNA (adenosine(37)-N6)-threonylcarbamoyltransferase complex transferase subunit TsaD [Tannerellaceae bacterium]|jgi:N6-L-threonylcarbamoyladenine synthase|nr:tRNA (adenosine(37)-N6)-threonylcarbamoyltransferase complex transferase subunit TsaD [Tannerellaceae bacterium]
MSVTILGIETSCDDTSAGVLQDGVLLSNVTYSQEIHSKYGGVVPELAARGHQQKIVPVVREALCVAGICGKELSGIAVTFGPGLSGSLLVGTSFAKGLSLSLNRPLIAVNHLHAHVLVHFIEVKGQEYAPPEFPYLCLLVSGGNTLIIQVRSPTEMHIIGQTLDDAAGEAFDKCAKAIGLPYPGGPCVSKLAEKGDPMAFRFARPNVSGYDFSFSGLKTSFLYTLRDAFGGDTHLIQPRIADLCASLEHTIIEILLKKVAAAVDTTRIPRVALAGGVSANETLRLRLREKGQHEGWKVYIPERDLSTDNGAMVALNGYLLYTEEALKNSSACSCLPFSRTTLEPAYREM